jgi:hypothetical protein
MSMQQRGYICENGKTHGKLLFGLARQISGFDGSEYIREFFSCLVRRIPTDGYDLIVLLHAVNGHWHVVVCLDDLKEVFAKSMFQQLRVFRKECE